MKTILFALLILLPSFAFCQPAIVTDSSNAYKFEIPDWLQIKETGKENAFGGIMPSVNGIQNAILITAFPKSDFTSFENFKDIYLTGNKFGQPTKYSKDHVWYGQNELIHINNRVEQKVFTFWNYKIYHNKFVLWETSKSFLWIQFVSTPETYEVNINKFEEFISKMKIS